MIDPLLAKQEAGNTFSAERYKNENKIRQYSTIKFFDGLVVLN